MRIIDATGYTVAVRSDCDWGKHQADDGYSVEVHPTANVEILSGTYVQDITTAEAGKRLGFTDFCNAGELYEFCEDGDRRAIAVSEMADNVIRPEMFEWVRIELTSTQIVEIENKYPDREGGFATSAEGWITKGDKNE